MTARIPLCVDFSSLRFSLRHLLLHGKMSPTSYQIVHYRYESRPASANLLTSEELASLARLHPEMVERLVEWGLVEPEQSEPELLFQETIVPRIWRIMRLRRDLGINWAGIGVVLDLLDRIDEFHSNQKQHGWNRSIPIFWGNPRYNYRNRFRKSRNGKKYQALV